MSKTYTQNLVNFARIATEQRDGITYHFIESEGFSDAVKHELATTLATLATDALMRDPWARVTLVGHQHDGGIGIHVGDGAPSPVYEMLRIPASWPKEHTASVIRKEMSRVPIYRNPQ